MLIPKCCNTKKVNTINLTIFEN